MLDELVDSDIVLRVGIGEELLFIGVGIRGVYIAELTQTVGGTVLQHVDDTTRTDVVTAGTLVATERELGVELQAQLVADLHVGLEVQVGTAYARAQDDTLVLRLCDRYVELYFL